MSLGSNPSGVLQRAPREGSRHTGDTGRAAPIVDDMPTDRPGMAEEPTSIPVRIVGTTETAPERLDRFRVASVPLVSTVIPVRAIGEDRQRTKLYAQCSPYPTPSATGVLIAANDAALLAGFGWYLAPGASVEIDAGSSVYALPIGGTCTLNLLVIDRPD